MIWFVSYLAWSGDVGWGGEDDELRNRIDAVSQSYIMLDTDRWLI
jgi:hypothetical protein